MSGKQKRAATRRTIVSTAVLTGAAPSGSILSNYSNEAGRGSATFADDAGLTWRRALLGGVAAGALWAAVPRQAQAMSGPPVNCTASPGTPTTVLNCSGDQHEGVVVTPLASPSPLNPGYSTVNVNDLTKNITPESGRPGIGIYSTSGPYSDGTATLNSDLGRYEIITSDGGDGIAVFAPYGVTIVHSGDITTQGKGANGIAAYSEYGDVSVRSTANIAIGDDGVGINALSRYGDVTVASTGNITGGAYSAGIRAVAGDGGRVKLSGPVELGRPSYGDIHVTSVGDITLTGAEGNDYTRGLAGIYASSAIGTSITIVSRGDISTTGHGRGGIYAYATNRSFGCGGDDSCDRLAGPTKDVIPPAGVSITSAGNITTTGDGANAISGYSYAGGVTISSTGDLTTKGRDSDGIAAQSYDGRIAVTSKGNITTSGDNATGIAAGSDYLGVTVRSTGDITTKGAGSEGIEAFGNDQRSCFDRKDDAGCEGSSAEAVTVVSRGNITTTGIYSHGINAGNGAGGDVSITTSGDIRASGKEASGIRVENGNTNTVTILDGTVSGGSDPDGRGRTAGVSFLFSGNATNTLNNHGTILGGGSGFAVVGEYGSETVNNFGTVTGNVDLVNGGRSGELKKVSSGVVSGPEKDIISSTPNAFNNNAGATFNSGDTVKLGDDGTLTNDGTLNSGGAGKVKTTSLWGSLSQSAKGMFAVDVDHAADKSDRINVTGNPATSEGLPGKATLSGTAALSGKVAPNLLSFDGATPGKSFTIVSADGGTTHAGLSVTDTAVIDYSLLYPNANDVVLKMKVNLLPGGLTRNQTEVAGYFERSIVNGTPAGFEEVIMALLNAPDVKTYSAYLDQLFANAAASSAAGGIGSGEALALALRSCPVAEGDFAQQRETSCLWAKPTFRRFDQDRSGGEFADIRDSTSGISGGFQTALGPNLWGGLGISVEDSDTLIDNTTKLDGTWVQGGAVLKWVNGAWKVSSSLTIGQADIDSERAIGIPGIALTATSGNTIDFGTGLTRLSYSFGATGFYVTPMIDFGVNYIKLNGFTEHGAGALGLDVGSTSEWIFTTAPAVEFGATIASGGLTFRPYAKAGVTFLSDDSLSTTAHFIGGPVGVAPFTITSKFDDVLADIGAGVQLFSTDGINLRFNYDGKFGDNTEVHGVDAKVTVNY